MGKEFIPLHLALKLKALGFDYPCFATWNGDVLDMSLQVPSDDYFTKAPTFSQAFRFFREKYNYSHEISKTYGGQYIPYANGLELNTNDERFQWIYKTYEEAELHCLDKLIKIAESKYRDDKLTEIGI